jgi:excinuclease ABC subunit C
MLDSFIFMTMAGNNQDSIPTAPRGPDSPDGKNSSEPASSGPDFERGLAVLKAEIAHLPARPGVYRMFNEADEPLYVGKARHLARRVASYTQPTRLTNRLLRMVAETVRLEITLTESEAEALLLEANLIKKLRPRYNILLKDDKSFAHIMLSSDHPFPQLAKHRGSQRRKAEYFGPFASTGAVNRTVAALSRAFLLRNCSDAVFAARSRPCLQYQIKRCTAPCVGRISEKDYAEQVAAARQFLSGQSDKVQRLYADEMHAASEQLDFETAALWRNRIRALTAIQANQDINLEGIIDADILALSRQGGQSCMQVFFVRGGSNYGNTAFFPRADASATDQDIVAAFITQFYQDRTPARLLLVSHLPEEAQLIAEALSGTAGRKISLSSPSRGGRRQLLEMARRNAAEALARKLSDKASQSRLLESLAEALGLETVPERVEIYDNSHIQGAHPVGALVAAGPEGFIKSAYRKFNIRQQGEKAAAGNDDFAMMRQMIWRRFERAFRADPDRQTDSWPDLLLIDGGPGQLGAVLEVLDELGLEDIQTVAISKGPDRHAGREQFHIRGRDSFTLPPDSAAMHFLQRLRDEAHRFVIGAHRARRTKSQLSSPLDGVPGIGAKRKKALLAHFGSARSVARAGLRDLAAVDGISEAMARQIYDWFHDQNS